MTKKGRPVGVMMSMQQYERIRGAAWERLLEPETFRPHYNRGHAMNDLGRTHESREALQKAIELNPRYAPALHLLGTIERATGNAPRAIELLRLAAAIDSRNPLVHYDLAWLSAKLAGLKTRFVTGKRRSYLTRGARRRSTT